MKIGFCEAHPFVRVLYDYFGTDLAYSRFQAELAANPEMGKVIPGTSALRKMRYPDPRRGKGRRGGLRIIYIWVPEVNMIGLIDIYDKNEASYITPSERKQFNLLADAFRQSLLRIFKERRT